jgi:hypothetical protein
MNHEDVDRLMRSISERFRERAVFPVGLQRYWEYEWTLRTLSEISQAGLMMWRSRTVADIGCGDATLFTDILAARAPFAVYACDPEPLPDTAHPCVHFSQMSAEQFCAEVAPDLALDAAVSVSVLEHCENRFAFCAALDTLPCPILLTCEFCRDDSDMAHCLVPLSVLTRCIGEFKQHYLARMDTCPVWAENARNGEWRPLAMLFLPIGERVSPPRSMESAR